MSTDYTWCVEDPHGAARVIDTLEAELATAQAEIAELKKDAARYRWIKTRSGLLIESNQMKWVREDGTTFTSSHRLCANDTTFAAFPTLDETVDAAIEGRK